MHFKMEAQGSFEILIHLIYWKSQMLMKGSVPWGSKLTLRLCQALPHLEKSLFVYSKKHLNFFLQIFFAIK